MSPTAELALEVLIARRRLGELVWTFDRKFGRALRELEGLGDVGFKSGVVEGTFLVWLTPVGLERHLFDGYVTPCRRGGVCG